MGEMDGQSKNLFLLPMPPRITNFGSIGIHTKIIYTTQMLGQGDYWTLKERWHDVDWYGISCPA